jgi:hypothetical protein
MQLCEDEELRARYTTQYTIGHVHLPLYRYTSHETNLTNNVEAMAKFRDKLREKHPELSWQK